MLQINKLKLLFSVLLIWLFLLVGSAFAVDFTLSWDAPTTNADGTPLTDLAGYKVYYGTASGTYGTPINVGNEVYKNMIVRNASGGKLIISQIAIEGDFRISTTLPKTLDVGKSTTV